MMKEDKLKNKLRQKRSGELQTFQGYVAREVRSQGSCARLSELEPTQPATNYDSHRLCSRCFENAKEYGGQARFCQKVSQRLGNRIPALEWSAGESQTCHSILAEKRLREVCEIPWFRAVAIMTAKSQHSRISLAPKEVRAQNRVGARNGATKK
jgi:hypothetical protein